MVDYTDIFLEVPEIGTLYLSDVLLFFIYPRGFVCETDNSKSYLLFELADEDNNDIGIWMAVAISKDELFKLKDQQISFQKIFETNKNNVFLIKHYYQNETTRRIELQDLANRDDYWNQLPKKPLFSERSAYAKKS